MCFHPWDKRLHHSKGTVDLVFTGSVEVSNGGDAILFGQRREESIRKSVLLDEFLRDDPEYLSPDSRGDSRTAEW